MALFKFTKAILEGKTIQVYNFGNHRRDFTYIDDIVEGVIRSLDNVAKPNESWDASAPDPSSSKAPYKVYNIGAQTPVHLLKFIETLEASLGVEAKKELLPLQPGDVPDTYADVSSLVNDTGYKPSTSIDVGVKNFVDWYKDFYNI
jgi:UDP-glucuronate 4-epimerase